jgi:hypothetical protein
MKSRAIVLLVALALVAAACNKNSNVSGDNNTDWLPCAFDVLAGLGAETRTTSPSLINRGTLTTWPVSSVAGLVPPVAVSPLIPRRSFCDLQVNFTGKVECDGSVFKKHDRCIGAFFEEFNLIFDNNFRYDNYRFEMFLDP